MIHHLIPMRAVLCFTAMVSFAILPLDSALAKTRHEYESGTCENNPTIDWYSVTTFVDGVATNVAGRDCEGRYYDRDICDLHTPVSSDPLGGAPPTFTGVCSTPTTWKARLTYNSNHVPIWIGGIDCDGRFYEIREITVNYPHDIPTNLD